MKMVQQLRGDKTTDEGTDKTPIIFIAASFQSAALALTFKGTHSHTWRTVKHTPRHTRT